jgi:hypothetical protein
VVLDRRCHSRIGIVDGSAVASLHLPTLPDQGQKSQVAKRLDRRVWWFCVIQTTLTLAGVPS